MLIGLVFSFFSAQAQEQKFYDVGMGEYRFKSQTDADVLSDRETEIWAQMFYPKAASGPSPLVILLHGNHGTCGRGVHPRIDDDCSYTFSGTCPAGYVVTPNHRGYDYLAQKLSQLGMIVISINANRGITCGSGGAEDFGLNLARGRLVLKHLSLLSEWNQNEGSPKSLGVSLRNKIDFSKVAMMGHSRGGEGVRAAFNLYHDNNSPWRDKILSPVNFRAIFEIGAVDGMTSRVLDALNTSWVALLPMCDGDVSDLQGMNPFDRMLKSNHEVRPASKSTLVVWGTNHNFFNTEWQQSDSYGCHNHDPLWEKANGKVLQQKTAEMTMIPFLKAKLLGQASDFLNIYDPIYDLSPELKAITRVDRNYVATVDDQWSPVVDITQFNVEDILKSKVQLKVVSLPPHPSDLKGWHVKWEQKSGQTYFEMPLSQDLSVIDLRDYEYFSLRLNRKARDHSSIQEQNFSLALVDRHGRQSMQVDVAPVLDLSATADHGLLMTVKLPVAPFRGVFDVTQVRALKFIFNKTNQGSLYVTQPSLLRNQFKEDLSVSLLDLRLAVAKTSPTASPVVALESVKTRHLNTRIYSGRSIKGAPVKIFEIKADQKFVVRDALPVLKIGDRVYKAGRFPSSGATDRMLFDIEDNKLRSSDKVQFFYEGSPDQIVYSGGRFGDALQ